MNAQPDLLAATCSAMQTKHENSRKVKIKTLTFFFDSLSFLEKGKPVHFVVFIMLMNLKNTIMLSFCLFVRMNLKQKWLEITIQSSVGSLDF